MKNNKQPRSDRPKAPFRASSAFAKSRYDENASKKRREDVKSFRGDLDKPRRTDDTKPRRADDGNIQRHERELRPASKSFKTSSARKDTRPMGGVKQRSDYREAYKPVGDGVLIWGLHAARAAWLNPKRRITRAWLSESGQKLLTPTQKEARDELLKRPDAKHVEREELDRLTPPNSVHQGIVIETSPLSEPSLHDIIGRDPPPDLILVLDQVTDPHNVGAILRSAAAFGAGAVVMTERNAPTTTGVLAKSASGALEHTPIVHVVNLARALDEMREAGYWCVGLTEEGEKSLGELDLSGRTVIVLGAEGDGLRHLTRQKCEELARLPTGGAIGSLNVSNAAAVALYEARRQAK